MVESAPPDPRRWWILVVCCLCMVVQIIDTSVLNVAIPTLIRELGATTSDIQWIIDSYIVVFAGLLLTAGALSDRLGRRRSLVTGLVLFGAASLAASFAGSPAQLVAARAGMGVGGAAVMPGTLAILTEAFDPAERKRAFAVWSSTLVLGALAGPIVGGLLLAHFWWGSVFLLNVPVAVVGVVAAVLIIPESRAPARRPDLVGVLLSIIGMTALVWAIIVMAEDGWTSTRVLVAFGIAALGLTAFVLWEQRHPEPMLPTVLFRDRNFNGGSLSIVLLSFAGGGVMLALTQYLQFVLGLDALRAGVTLVPLLLSVMLFNAVGVAVDKRFGARVAVSGGLLLLAAGFALLSVTTPGDGYARLVLALVVTGAGSGTAVPASYGTVLAALPREHAGVGSAVNETVQQIGQALSVAVLGSILTAAFTATMPEDLNPTARRSIGDALALAAATRDSDLAHTAQQAFVAAMSLTTRIGAIAATIAAAAAAVLLRPGIRPATKATPDASTRLSSRS